MIRHLVFVVYDMVPHCFLGHVCPSALGKYSIFYPEKKLIITSGIETILNLHAIITGKVILFLSGFST